MSAFVTNILGSLPGIGLLLGHGFRPPQWSEPPLTSITVNLPTTSSTQQVGTFPAAGGPFVLKSNVQAPVNPSTTYFFDAVTHLEHSQSLRATEHPTQGGASIVDHAYLMPARLLLEVGMSDAIDSYLNGQWTSDASKSVSAYQTLLYIQSLRVPVIVTTRLRVYENMVIEEIRAGDNVRTLHGLKAEVIFKEIIVGTVTRNTISARPSQTQDMNPGTAQPEPVSPAVQKVIDNLRGAFGTAAPPK